MKWTIAAQVMAMVITLKWRFFDRNGEYQISFQLFLSIIGWSSDDDHELVEKVKSTAKENDKVNYKTRLRQMDWKEIAFKNYTAEDCEKRFTDHLKHIRRYRNLSEVVVDIEANIKKCPLKKPLNSYQLFVKDQLMNATTSGDFVRFFLTLIKTGFRSY